MIKTTAKGTKIFTVSSSAAPEIRAVAELIRAGELVAFPTETVYGLGAHALRADAVAKIFAAKERPADNPLIIHIYDLRQLKTLAADIPEEAWQLAHHFWPGPLTLILRKKAQVPDLVTGGLDSVAIRMPNHTLALALLQQADVPVAAPSANLSGRPSPTTADHVLTDLDGRIAAVLDGGPCSVGVESTVLDIRQGEPKILRPGGVTPEEISAVLRRPCSLVHWLPQSEDAPPSPGLKYLHYAPRAPLYLLTGAPERQIKKMQELLQNFQAEGKRVGLLVSQESAGKFSGAEIIVLGSRRRPDQLAAGLFAALRSFDEKQVDVILAEGYSKKGVGLAVMNRLQKAAGPRVINVGGDE
ncbi:MAG: threonylcarbamoyl-AMP synthase [Firmicutes bacterium]|nr:threonylcarbamoyl-AMP synthase [Bacillota bacterium]